MTGFGQAPGGTPVLSVCIHTRRYGPVLAACLESLRTQKGAPPFELLVSVDRDPRIVDQVRDVFPHANVGTISGALPGAARNLLIEQARGDLLIFLDDDTVAEAHYLRRALEIANAHPDVGVFGGPNLTPPGSSTFQFVQGAVLGSLIGAGPVRKRYGVHPAGPTSEFSLTLCNLMIRREVAVPFAPDLVCAEENEAMRRLRHNGVNMRTEPDLVVFHERRGTGSGFAAQMYKYGQGRGQLLRRDPRALRLPHLVPCMLVLYLVTLPLLALWSLLFVIPGLLYLVVVGATAARISHSTGRLRALARSVKRFGLAAYLVMVVHILYGVGILRGMVRRLDGTSHSPVWVSAGDAIEPPFA